jgi:ankyrin repeat protein
MRACYDKPVDHMKWLIEHGANIGHSRMQRGKTETVLHIAHKQEDAVSKKEKIDLLLGSGCNVPEDLLNNDHIKKRLKQKTDLHKAVVAGELKIVQKLLAEGAELWIDVKTDAEEFLIDIASGLANRDIYDLLLSKSKKIPRVPSKSARKWVNDKQ